MAYADLSLRDFLGVLASASPTPGGGTGSAVVGAAGAALVRMLAVLTIGRPKYAADEALMRAIADQAEEHRSRLLLLADEDAQAYDAVSAAYKLPKDTEEDKTARRLAIQSAVRGAIAPPMKVMEVCADLVSLAKAAVAKGNVNAASDGAAGAEFARSAMTVAAYNVRINLTLVDDDRWVRDVRTKIDEMLYMAQTTASEIDSKVQDMWKPRPKSGAG